MQCTSHLYAILGGHVSERGVTEALPMDAGPHLTDPLHIAADGDTIGTQQARHGGAGLAYLSVSLLSAQRGIDLTCELLQILSVAGGRGLAEGCLGLPGGRASLRDDEDTLGGYT